MKLFTLILALLLTSSSAFARSISEKALIHYEAGQITEYASAGNLTLYGRISAPNLLCLQVGKISSAVSLLQMMSADHSTDAVGSQINRMADTALDLSIGCAGHAPYSSGDMIAKMEEVTKQADTLFSLSK